MVANLHFANDTLLFSSARVDQAIILKLILYCFEAFAGLKINFSKSCLIVLGSNPAKERIKLGL